MKVDFRRLTWENYPSTETPINADNLNRLEEGVAGLYSDMRDIEEELDGGVGEYVTDWLNKHVDPAGSAVVVDNTLSIEGAAADAKKVGDEILASKVVVDDTLSTEGAAADAKKTGDELTSLKEDSNNINGSQIKTSQIDYTSFTINNNKKITGYDTQTFIPSLANENGSCVVDFAVADLSKYATIKFPRCTKSSQWFILYSDSQAWNFLKTSHAKTNNYDLSNDDYGIINCAWLTSTTYTRIAMAFDGAVDITTDTGFSTFFDLLQSANQNKYAVPEVRKIYYETAIDISVKSANANVPFTISKGETLTFINNTAGNTALYAIDTDGTLVTISSGIASGGSATFLADKDYYILRYWSQQLGTVTVKNANSVIAAKQADAENSHIASVNMFSTIAAIGDSYTAGSSRTSGGTWVDKRNLSWIATMGKRSGTEWKNYGRGGATTKSYLETTEFASALSDNPCDIYFFALGQNDGNQSLTIGTVADINDSDYTQNPETFYGCYGKIIQQIKDHAPNAKLVMVTGWVQGATWTAYDEAIRVIAAHYSIPVIEPFDDYFFNSALYNDYKEYGHPTALGYSSMGIAMERLFSKCVVNNPSYFKFATIG